MRSVSKNFMGMGGTALFELRGCMPEVYINACLNRGIELVSVKRTDDFTLEILVPSGCLREAEALAEKNGFELCAFQRDRAWMGFLKRRIFPAFVAFLVIGILFWSKFYVWEISISGNDRVRDGEILSALKESGVSSGEFWPGFSADNIRSEVLAAIPELSWITVNMHGSRAEVIAVERKEKPEMVYEGGSASIVADKQGFVRRVEALAGQSAVKAGEIVKSGDVLISGVLESSFAPPDFTRARGSVKAETNTEYQAVIPSESALRRYTGEEKHRFALIIGNNRINFYSDSSISDAFCDKIIDEWNFEVSGLFKLPLSIVHETGRMYECERAASDELGAEEALRQHLYSALERSLGDGEVLSEKLSYSQSKGLCVASLRVRCLEEIGVLSPIGEKEKQLAFAKYTEKADDE